MCAEDRIVIFKNFPISVNLEEFEEFEEISRNDKMIISVYIVIRSAFRKFVKSENCIAALEIPSKLN
jgi:hypothetical protein